MNLIGTNHKFDVERYPFAPLFLRHLNGALTSRQKKAVKSLADLHHVFSPENLSEAYDELYSFEERPEFLDLYCRFIHESVVPLIPGAYFQRKPGIRIHLPNTRTVQYHTDEWYG